MQSSMGICDCNARIIMKKTIISFSIWLMAMVLFTPCTEAQTWQTGVPVETVFTGTGGRIGQYTSLVVANGNPAFIYYDETRGDLMYVRATDASGTTWGTPVFVDSAGNVGQHGSLIIVSGNPAISYYDVTNGDLKYVRASDASGTTWGTPVTIDATGTTGWFTCMLVVNSNPAIAYYDNTNGDLRYVRASNATGSSWGTPVTVESTNDVGSWPSMAIVSGNPAIAYYTNTSTDLKYVRASDASGSTWGSPITLATTGTVGQWNSLLVVNGNPAISYYYGASNFDLMYIRATDATGTTWGSPVTVDATGQTGNFTRMLIVKGFPAISYSDATNTDRRFVRATDASGTTWGTPVTIDTACSGVYAEMVIVNGNPALSYYDPVRFKPSYTRAADDSGSTWNTPIVFDAKGKAGQYPSVAIVNGNPAISYYDQTETNLKYVRASNTTGSAWNTAVTIDVTGNVGQYTSLVVANSNPAISYYDVTNGDLKYVRASDASGTTWGTPVTVDATGAIGQYTSMAVVNGNPAISYYDVTNGNLKYVRASDASGSTWGTPVTVDATGVTGQYTCLKVVNGYPAISYYDSTNGDLRYVLASDASGSTWGTPVTVDATGNSGQYTSLVVANSNPAISYYDVTNGDLKYIRATDASGSTWGTAVTVDATGTTGQYTCLALVSGYPAISYYDATNGDLRYVLSANVSGSSWGTPAALESSGTTGQYTSMCTNGIGVFLAYYFPDETVAKVMHGATHTWTGGAGTTNWFATGNWSNATVPLSSSNIDIPAGLTFYPDISSGTAVCNNIYIENLANFTVSGGELQVSGDLNNYSTINATGGTITLNGASAQSVIAGIINATNLTLNNSAGATITSGTVNVLGTYTPTAGTLTTGGFLTLKSTASATARIAAGSSSGGYISGSITAERYQPGKRCFRFYGHPFTTSIALSQLTDDIDITGSGGASNGFTATVTNNPSAFWFDVTAADTSTTGANPGWTAFTSANTASWDRYELLRLLVRGSLGEGLSGGSYTPSASTFDAAGAVNQGTQTITLTKGSGTSFVGCGNPFPSGIQMNAVARGSNVGANYYAWDATSGATGAYVTNAWTLSYILPPYAAFFTTVSATDNITIEEADKDTGGVALFKGTANDNWVELLISDSSLKWDRLLINFDDSALSVEDKLDGKKLYNPGLDFFTLSKDSTRLAVDVRPYADSASIPLGLTAYNRYNKYVIKTGMFDIPTGTKLYLHDKYLNKSEELMAGFEYWFDVTTDSLSQGNNRFEINMVGKPTNGISHINETVSMIQLVPNPAYNSVKVSFGYIDGTAHIRLMSVTGKVVYSAEANGGTGSITIPLQGLPAGMYIVELQGRNARFTEKLIKE
jgi:hypothetical protein